MRIASFVSGNTPTPPPAGVLYAPMDIAVSVCKGLARRGHDVTYYGPEGTVIDNSIKIETCGLKPLMTGFKTKRIIDDLHFGVSNIPKFEERLETLWDQFILSEMFKHAEEGKYDLLHLHPVSQSLALAKSHPHVQVVYTLHDPIYPWRAKMYDLFNSPNQHFISISDNQRKGAPDLNYTGTVYNGVDTETFCFNQVPGDYYLWTGRIVQQKGLLDAIQASKLAGVKLKIIGLKQDEAYWRSVESELDSNIVYLGVMEKNNLVQYYQRARATLVPIHWEEPFGLVMTESMACGTPVIAYGKGSVPEIIIHGETGYIVDSVEEMAQRINTIGSINRQTCREHVLKNFCIDSMVEKYETIFKAILVESGTTIPKTSLQSF